MIDRLFVGEAISLDDNTGGSACPRIASLRLDVLLDFRMQREGRHV